MVAIDKGTFYSSEKGTKENDVDPCVSEFDEGTIVIADN